MPYKTENGPSWFPLPCMFAQDAELMLVSVPAQMLFLRVLGLCSGLQTQGRISSAQMQTLYTGLSKPKQYLDELCTKALLTLDGTSTGPVREYVVSNAAHWLKLSNRTPAIPAGQNKNAPVKITQNEPRARAHVKKEREKEREEERTPSGSVRSSSAQAAPRVAGGATQPAPEPVVDEGGKLSRADAIALARQNISAGRTKNPAATGIDTKFSKYDPDRPITPINSAMASGWNAE